MTDSAKMSLQEAMAVTSDKVTEVHVMEGEKAENAPAVVCATVAEIPIPPCKSSIEFCSKCARRIWVSHSSPKKPPRICYHCYVDLVQSIDEGEPLEIGVSPSALQKALKRKLS